LRRQSGRRLLARALFAADVAALALAFGAVALLLGPPDGALAAPLFACMLLAYAALAQLRGLYDCEQERPDHGTTDELPAIFQAVSAAAWVLLVPAWAIEGDSLRLEPLVLTWALVLVLVPSVRTALRALGRRRGWFDQNAVIVGAGKVGQLVARKLLQRPRCGLNLLGFIDPDGPPRDADLGTVPWLGQPERLRELVDLHDVDRVIMAFPRGSNDEAVALVRSLRGHDVRVDIVPRLFEGLGTKVGVHSLKGLSLVSIPPAHLPRGALTVKRTMDVVISSIALVLLAPLLAYIVLRIKRDSPGPALYRHDRVGQDGRPFRLYKFRTMYRELCRGHAYGGDSAEAAFARLMEDAAARAEFEGSYKLTADPRVTPFGHFLRRTSLDELPQLINVLRGDLSLVGPRPVTADELPRYRDNAPALLHVRPGLSGHWQINGRSQVSYEERVRLDLSYLSGWSLRGDIMILAKTVARFWSLQQDAV
jgi:exopolysaccharide biosynthesis polyprenyl glycosylphosphotransferase